MKVTVRDVKVNGLTSKREVLEFNADRIQIDIINGQYDISLITYEDVVIKEGK